MRLFELARMKRRIIVFIGVLVCVGCVKESQVDNPPAGPPVLEAVDISNASVLFMNEESSSARTLYAIDFNRSVFPVELKFSGMSSGIDETFEPYDVNADYFLLLSSEFKQLYFVSKQDGQAHPSAYFPIDYLNYGKIVCSDSICYTVGTDEKMYKVTNFLSPDASVAQISQIQNATSVRFDGHGILFFNTRTGTEIGVFINEEAKLFDFPKITGSWFGNDGYRRVINKEGEIEKFSGSTFGYERSIPRSLIRVLVHTFPELEKAIAFQNAYNLYQFFELTSPFTSRGYPQPSLPDDKSFLRFATASDGATLHIISAAVDSLGQIQNNFYHRLNADTYRVDEVPLEEVDGSIQALTWVGHDTMLAHICVDTGGGCQDRFAFFNPDGSFDYLLPSGNAIRRIIRIR